MRIKVFVCPSNFLGTDVFLVKKDEIREKTDKTDGGELIGYKKNHFYCTEKAWLYY